jgi:hypothetical protein
LVILGIPAGRPEGDTPHSSADIRRHIPPMIRRHQETHPIHQETSPNTWVG